MWPVFGPSVSQYCQLAGVEPEVGGSRSGPGTLLSFEESGQPRSPSGSSLTGDEWLLVTSLGPLWELVHVMWVGSGWWAGSL
jgi:hypothetical protein